MSYGLTVSNTIFNKTLIIKRRNSYAIMMLILIYYKTTQIYTLGMCKNYNM